MPTLRITLTFDGGSRGNPGPAYGSYVLESKDPRLRRPRPIRLTFAHGTNNEAEYWTLLKALQDTSAMLLGLRVPLEDVELTVRGDSQLVLSQVAGEWKAKDDRMRRLRGEVQELLEPFGRVRFQHQPRSRSVRQLGH